MFSNVADGTNVSFVALLVGNIVVLKGNVGFDVSKLVGELDCDKDIEELDVLSTVGSFVIFFEFIVGIGDNFKTVGTDVFDNTGVRVGYIVLLVIVVLEVTKLVGELDCDDNG